MRKLKLDELGREDIDTFRTKSKFQIYLVVDNVRSALNVGSIFRTADAFAIAEVILVGITARPPHKEILKTALGSTASVAWHYFDTSMEAIEYLNGKQAEIWPLEQTDQSEPLDQLKIEPDQIIAFVLGNEVDGVHENFLQSASKVVEITQFGTKHSLNVAVCAGIAAFWAVNQLSK